MTFPKCLITGTLLNADASPQFDVAVYSKIVDAGNNATFKSSALVTTLPQVVRTDENGFFAFSLPREVEAIITIEEADYEKQVTIPDQSAVNLEDL
jgi:hypothetical protein